MLIALNLILNLAYERYKNMSGKYLFKTKTFRVTFTETLITLDENYFVFLEFVLKKSIVAHISLCGQTVEYIV